MYWLDTSNGYACSINEAPIATGKAMVLADGLPAGTPMAIDSTNVYWFDTSVDAIDAIPIGGGHVSTIPVGVESAQAVASDGSCAYVYADDQVRAVRLSGGTPKVLAWGLLKGTSLVVDETFVYWASVDGRVMRAPKACP